MDETAIGRPAYISRRYFKLKSGHSVIGTFLNGIGKADSDRY